MNASSRLWKRLKPSSGNPRNLPPGGAGFAQIASSTDLSRLEYCFMPSSAQIELWPAEKVAAQANVSQAPNGINFAGWGETRVSEADLERLVGAVPALLAPALEAEPTTLFRWLLPIPAR